MHVQTLRQLEGAGARHAGGISECPVSGHDDAGQQELDQVIRHLLEIARNALHEPDLGVSVLHRAGDLADVADHLVENQPAQGAELEARPGLEERRGPAEDVVRCKGRELPNSGDVAADEIQAAFRRG